LYIIGINTINIILGAAQRSHFVEDKDEEGCSRPEYALRHRLFREYSPNMKPALAIGCVKCQVHGSDAPASATPSMIFLT